MAVLFDRDRVFSFRSTIAEVMCSFHIRTISEHPARPQVRGLRHSACSYTCEPHPMRVSHLLVPYFCSSERNPASVVAFIKALVSVFLSSNVTTACFCSYRTSTLETPSTLLKAFLTVIGQAGHVMPGTIRVTVFDAAQAEAVSRARLKARLHNCRLFKANSFP